jgi:hypothetical protein
MLDNPYPMSRLDARRRIIEYDDTLPAEKIPTRQDVRRVFKKPPTAKSKAISVGGLFIPMADEKEKDKGTPVPLSRSLMLKEQTSLV